MRTEYDILIQINGKKFFRLVIDPHYKEKHKTIDDPLILRLVALLHGQKFRPVSEGPENYKYFVRDRLELEGKSYKIVWTLKDDEHFIGIINCYRRD